MKSKIMLLILIIAVLTACSEKPQSIDQAGLTPKEQLGKFLFFDTNLSDPPGQACAICHGPAVGWSGPDSKVNHDTAVYPGALAPRFGNRRPPTAAYAGFNPKLHRDEEGNFVGGLFWDGRATGWDLGDPLAEQAMGPFLNPLEQNMADKAAVIKKVMKSEYAGLFREVWGEDMLTLEDMDGTFERMARSTADFERSSEMNPFSSKFDDFWRNTRKNNLEPIDIDENNWKDYSNYGLDEEELKGLMLFNTKGECAECHVLTSENGLPPLFTDFTYDNLGVPKNPNNPFYIQDRQFNPDGKEWIDPGLAGFLETTPEFQEFAAENYGKHKVPTLRNVDKRPFEEFAKSFMHNGVFQSLKEVVDFYNTRDIEGTDWPEPEVEENVNTEELGDLELTDEEVALIVKFMQALSDR